MKKFNQKMLSTTVSTLMTMSIAIPLQASDIEIYKLPDQTELSVFMMLDTSGSMDIGVVGATACDLKSNQSSSGTVSGEISANGYTRNYCRLADGSKKYYARSDSDGANWKTCGSTGSTNRNNCTTNSSVRPNLVGMALEQSSGYRYYYNYGLRNDQKAYDRISRLKDALYTLATSDQIPENTRIGIGTYPYVAGNENNQRGRVRVAIDTIGKASPLSAQRQNILNLISGSSFYGTGGTPTSSAYAESAAYLLGTTTGGGSYSGTSLAPSGILSNSRYIMPLRKEADPKCSGKGIYFLTDGQPQTPANTTTSTLMAHALGLSSYSTSVSATEMPNGSNDSNNNKSDWRFIGSFAKSLNTGSLLSQFFTSPVRNNEHVIKTAVVGFGSVFDVPDLPNVTDADKKVRQVLIDPKTDRSHTYYNCSLISGSDAKNACNWGQKSKFSDGTLVPNIGGSGGFGEGGFYSASSTSQVVQSLVDFVADMEPEFDPIATGSPTLPIDALNPIQIQPYGYYAKFTPKPEKKYQLWLGDLNQYNIYNGALYNRSNTQRLIKADGSLDNTVTGLWDAGAVSKLPLGTLVNDTTQVKTSNRKVFTNRAFVSNVAADSGVLSPVNLNTLFDTNGLFATDPKKNYWLNLLGYKVGETSTGWTVNTLPTEEQRQMGAVMHSTPVLLTQEGKIVVPTTGVDKGKVTTTAREDYLMFGSNQGILHVVDAEDGKEVFAFVPNEMMEKQSKGFLGEGSTDGGSTNLFYGVDGQWTAFTQYVSKTDGTLTVKDSGRTNDDNESYLSGLQWVYGGLRMGGQSYYALDLSDIASPKLKFQIDPVTSSVKTLAYDADGKPYTRSKSFAALGNMGQSWSKPTLTYVNWGGQRKLVMLVGGGYDVGYEAPDYNQTNQKGAGVYMFDASNGDLLWWTSSKVGSTTSATTNSGLIATKNENLKFSVVSQINAIDRDGDGLSDILYFGDLGGQAFRVDLNNRAQTTGAFATRVVRLYNGNVSGGISPRFYEMPSFSVHDGVDGVFGALALSSGNRSSPLAGRRVTSTGNTVVTATANDAVFVVYDNDVARTDLYSALDAQLRTKDVALTDLVLNTGVSQITGTGASQRYNGGWKYHYANSAGKYKGMNEIYSLDSMLYVNVYHKDGTGIAGDCGSGVIGDSELYQFCLPTGKCSFYGSSTNTPNKIKLGGGILGTGLGQGYTNIGGDTSLVVNRPDDPTFCEKPENKNKPECQLFDTSAKLRHLRWYELR